MEYKWTLEQRLLRQTLERYTTERPVSGGAGASEKSEAAAQTMWQDLADLGMLALPFDEQYGGTAGSALDLSLVMEAMGRGLMAVPYVPSIVLAGGLLKYGADDQTRAELIPPLAAGKARYAFAFAEVGSRFNLSNVQLSAKRDRNGYRLKGRKIVVLGAPRADLLFVTTRTAGDVQERKGISVFHLPRDTPNLVCRDYVTVDGHSASEIEFNDVSVLPHQVLGPLDGALPLVERVIDEAIGAICAEAVGAMTALTTLCIEYAKARVAFGQPLSKFQVLQHRLVDMQLANEHAAAMALKAAVDMDRGTETRSRSVSAAKVLVARESLFVGKAAIQIHGAIGMTDELNVGRYFKRLIAISTLFGSADHHLARYIDQSRRGLEGSVHYGT